MVLVLSGLKIIRAKDYMAEMYPAEHYPIENPR